MIDQNQKDGFETYKRSNGAKSKVKGFITTITAGVIGSVLTLTIIPHTDYLKDLYPSSEQTGNVIAGQTDTSSKKIESNIVATQTAALNNTSSIADTVENASKAIVGIVNLQKQQQNNYFSNTASSENVETGSGSGVIFKKTKDAAFIVTNNHVIEGASEIEISLHDGKKTKATLIGADVLTDLAVLKIDPKYVNTILSFGDSSKLRPGEEVLAIGNPLGLDLSRTVTQGIVSAVNRSIPVSTSAGQWELNVIQTDAAINPGNSGGALINTQGQVVGINSLKISENGVEGLGFAIPSNDLLPIVNEIIKRGKIGRPYMGVGLASLDEVPQMYLQDLPSKITGGAMITNIDKNSAAGESGLQVRDVIVSIDHTKVTTSNDLRKYLYSKVKVGDEVTIKLYRNGHLETVKLTLSSNNETNS